MIIGTFVAYPAANLTGTEEPAMMYVRQRPQVLRENIVRQICAHLVGVVLPDGLAALGTELIH